MNFGLRLKTLMEEGQITQTELAKRIGFTQRAISKWVNLQSEPTETAILKIADQFSVSIDYLLGQTEDPDAIILKNQNLKPREQQLIENYRKMPPQTQEYVFGIVQNLALNS